MHGAAAPGTSGEIPGFFGEAGISKSLGIPYDFGFRANSGLRVWVQKGSVGRCMGQQCRARQRKLHNFWERPENQSDRHFPMILAFARILDSGSG